MRNHPPRHILHNIVLEAFTFTPLFHFFSLNERIYCCMKFFIKIYYQSMQLINYILVYIRSHFHNVCKLPLECITPCGEDAWEAALYVNKVIRAMLTL